MTLNRVLVGVIGAPHGVRGEVRVKSFTGDPSALAAYGALLTVDGRRLAVLSAAPHKDMLVVRFEGFADRDAAAALTGTELFVERDRLPPAEADEFYLADLIGLAVATAAGERLGTVVAVPNYGACDLLEIAPIGGKTSVLLPFTQAFVPEIDLGQGRIVVAPPAGLFEEEMQDSQADEETVGRPSRRGPADRSSG